MLKLNKNSLYLRVSSFAATCKKDGLLNILAATGDFELNLEKELSNISKNRYGKEGGKFLYLVDLDTMSMSYIPNLDDISRMKS